MHEAPRRRSDRGVGPAARPLLVSNGHTVVGTTRTPDRAEWLPVLAAAIGAKPPGACPPGWLGCSW
jgi:hypothetical protein